MKILEKKYYQGYRRILYDDKTVNLWMSVRVFQRNRSHLCIYTYSHMYTENENKWEREVDFKELAHAVCKDWQVWNLDLIDFCRPFVNRNYTFFSGASGMFLKIDCILGHKTSINTLKRFVFIQNIFSN